MNSNALRIRATGPWTFVVGPEFEIVDNVNSVQAVHGDRAVYVSSRSVHDEHGPMAADRIRSMLTTSFGSGERFAHTGRSVQGDAEVVPDADGWLLRAVMCANGTFATCAVNFAHAHQRDWAVSVWRSLSCEADGG